TKDLGFLPIPKRLRYDPDSPAHFGLLLNATFGIASTFTVANLYYCQPLLIQFSRSCNVSYDTVSSIPTLVQAGKASRSKSLRLRLTVLFRYATGILLISTLSDLVRRRPLILLLVFTSASLTIGLAITTNFAVFEALCFLVCLVTVVPQILMPLAADLAPPECRASALSIILAGLLFGVLIARVLAGIIAQYATWRVVYYLSIGVQCAVLLMLYLVLPDYPAKNKGTTYFGILYSMAKFCVTAPLLIQAVLINLPSSACFTNFWVTLTFLLGGSPYHYSTLVIGLFGLVGMVGVAMAPILGRFIDSLVPWFATVIATLAYVLCVAVEVGADGINVSAVVIVCIGIDVFRQMVQVSLTTTLFGLDPSARSRLNAVILVSLFVGQVMGTAVGSKVFTEYGWRPAAALNLAWSGFMLIIILIRGPHVSRYTWVGYRGGLEVRKRKVEGDDRSQSHNGMQIGDIEGSASKGDAETKSEDYTRSNRDKSDQ
ncbi:MFS general substrate transporter, partial [Laetiporus sulphureus 93-53]